MGQAKRRQQLLGDSYGQVVPLEECTVPDEIQFYYPDDAFQNQINMLLDIPPEFRPVLL
jgi:hypothetical protein